MVVFTAEPGATAVPCFHKVSRLVLAKTTALYGLLRELETLDLIVESDRRPAADEDDERRRYFALTPHGKRVLDAEVRRLEAIVHHARSSRALRKASRA